MRQNLVHAIAVGASILVLDAEANGRKDEIPFSRVSIRIEYNATDEDVGIQLLLDGEPWKRVRMFNPRDRKLLDIVGQGSLRRQGLTELFFESSEPSLEEVSLEEFLARFPEGKYELEGVTTEGVELEGEATLTHAIPAGAQILFPLPSDVMDPSMAVIEWRPVTETIDGHDVEIAGYQVIVEQPEPLRVLSMDLPPTLCDSMTCRATIPPEFFLLPGTIHKFEVLAIEESGNQTISSGEFLTSN